MDSPNRRSRTRVRAEKLPPGMRQFRLDFGANGVYTGNTIDASLTSISFLVKVPTNRIREHLVKLTSADKKIQMTQELVYVKAVDPSHSRISFMLESESTPEIYRRALSKALKG
ncbi:MAG: hypothetical protein R6X08_03855 [Desulfosalsimonadaceae bacterium]